MAPPPSLGVLTVLGGSPKVSRITAMKPHLSFTTILALALLPLSTAWAAPTYSHVDIIVTARDTGQRLTSAGDETLADSPPITEKQDYIFVDPLLTFQTMIGIGGALTDASAETFYKLPEDKQREILRPILTQKTASAIHLRERPFIAAIFRVTAIRT